MFYDLNIKRQNILKEDTLLATVERLINFGYKGLAITTCVDEYVFDKSKKEKEAKKKNSVNAETSLIPLPFDFKDFKAKFPNVYFYNRINISVSDASNIRKFIQCKELKKYDIISFQPESQSALKTLTGIAEVDIISYNPENRCILSFNRKLYNQFVNQNVFFELTYAPAIVDHTARRNLLSLSHIYHAVGKSKNIIVTSGAEGSQQVRGPYDVINFNILFGLKEKESKSSITRNCEKLLLRARKQRRGKSTIEMVQIKNKNENSLLDEDLEEKMSTDE